MKTILVPVDFSPVSRSLFKEMRKLAALVNARIVLFHAIKQPLVVPDYPGLFSDSVELLESAERSARKQLETQCRELEKGGMEAEFRLTIGLPGAEIVQLAKRLRPEYVVMGSHGHGAFYEFVVGSTTRAVLREVRCPVVVINSPAPAKTKT